MYENYNQVHSYRCAVASVWKHPVAEPQYKKCFLRIKDSYLGFLTWSKMVEHPQSKIEKKSDTKQFAMHSICVMLSATLMGGHLGLAEVPSGRRGLLPPVP